MVNVKLAVDFQALSYVTVTAYKNKEELMNLGNSIIVDNE